MAASGFTFHPSKLFHVHSEKEPQGPSLSRCASNKTTGCRSQDATCAKGLPFGIELTEVLVQDADGD